MNAENATLEAFRSQASATGEVASVTESAITVSGWFTPGLSVELYAGRRVFVLTEDEVLALMAPVGSVHL